MKHLKVTVRKILQDCHMVLFIGLMFMISGFVSFIDNFCQRLLGHEIEFLHGNIFLGLVNILVALAMIAVGGQSVESVAEQGMRPGASDAIARLEERVRSLE
ncbi:MAG: hypothetical protein RDV41_03675, partial [Planctomycetota bacterium]|nr:hypothetical protein [Planctomycetota bacterium]